MGLVRYVEMPGFAAQGRRIVQLVGRRAGTYHTQREDGDA